MKIRRTVGALILILAVFGPATLYAQAPAPVVARPVAAAVPAVEAVPQPVRLLVGRSTIVDVGAPITRVSLTSADVADAVVTAPGQLLLNGKTPGVISMFVWDRGGAIRRYEVSVSRDLARLEEQLHQIFPAEKVDVRANGKNVVVSGTVSSKDVMEKVANLVGGFVDSKDEVVSLLQLGPNAPSNQVLLHVRFAEVSRSALTELGVGIFTSPTGIKNNIGRVTTEQFPSADFSNLQSTKANSDFGSAVTSASGQLSFGDFLNLFLFNEKYDLGAVVKALQTRGLFQNLAEPNLVAESGKEASFLAGGEFPVPVPQASAGGTAITVSYKEFGIRLTFTPVVNGNRIHLKLRPEVSTLDFGNAVVLQGFRIPALTTRRTETELELQDHQTFAIAGLLNNQMTKTLQKIPGIGDIPILGLLFQSKAAQKDQTELVVMITPEILPLNSNGVTPNLPRLAEPYLAPLPQKQTVEPPPPAFSPTSEAPAATPRGQAASAAPARQGTNAQDPRDPRAAAAAMSALSPGARGSNVHVDSTGQTTPAQTGTAAGPGAAATPGAAAPAADTSAQAGAVQQRTAEEDKRAAKQAEADRKKQKELEERQAKLAREQAERDAEAAKKAHQAEIRKEAADREVAKKQAERAAEAAKKEEEARRKRDRAIAEAQAKIRAAEGVYKTETGQTDTDKKTNE